MTDAGASDLAARLGAAVEPQLAGFSGRIAVAAHGFAHPGRDAVTWLRGADVVLPSASLIKLPLLVFALEQVAAGQLALGRRLRLEADDPVGGSGVLKTLQPGLEPTLRDLLTLMIVVSDNTATNRVIDLLGVTATNAWLRAAGMVRTELVGKLQLPEAKRNDAQRRGRRNATCAADVLGLLLRLERGELLPAAETGVAREILLEQQFTEAMGRWLPRDPELDGEAAIRLASKSGCLRGVWHDAGIAYRGDAPLWALVVMTADSDDRGFGWEQEGMLRIAGIARAVHAVLGA